MNRSERKLLGLFTSMDSAGQTALLEYAEFLAQRHPLAEQPATPLDIARPQEESVVAAIKRLSSTYPMLDRQVLLHETSSYMMQHMMQGRAAVEVIDDLEIYFREQYELHKVKSDDVSDS